MIALLALAYASPRLTDPVRPTSLDVALDVAPERDTTRGTATIGLDVTARITSFHLHGEGLTDLEVTLTRGKKRVPARIEAVDGGRLRVDVDKPLKPGRHTLTIDYTGRVQTQPFGLFRFTTDGQSYLVTQLEADDARTVWPAFDEPSFKVPFGLTVTAPAGLAVVSNGARVAQIERDGSQTVQFATTPPIPTYAAALAVGPYDSVEVDGVGRAARVYTPAGRTGNAAAAIEELPRVVQALEAWFGEPHPYEKVDLIAATDFAFGAMENPGAIVMNEGLLVPLARETPANRSFLVEVLAHEVGHQWFGNLVTMAWWDDFWLNESFAQWIGGRMVHALHPELRRDIHEVRRTQGMVGRDGGAKARPLRTEVDPAAVFETANFAVYPKGEALLSMLEAWIGPEAFQAGVRSYLAEHREGNATSADLFRALSAAGGVDVGAFMQGFLDRPGAPLLTFDGDSVRQSRYTALGAGELPFTPWTLPLHLRVGRPDGTNEVRDVLLDGPEGQLDLGETTWVLPVADGVGYYAWDLPDAGWTALLAASPALEAREQVAVLGGMELLVDAGARDAAWALGLVGQLGQATDPDVVDAALGLTGYVTVAEDLDDPALEAASHAWTRATLTPWLDAIGREPRPDEPLATGGLRRSLLARLADAGDATVRAQARSWAEAWLADPSSVDPELAPWAVGVWVQDAPPAQYDALIARAEAAGDPGERSRFLRWAASVRDPEASRKALERALLPETPYRETFALINGVESAHPDDQDFVIGWMMEHYDVLAAKLPPQFRMRMAGMGAGCDLAAFEKTRSFFADPARAVTGTDRVLAETEASVRACMTRRETHGASVRAFLATR